MKVFTQKDSALNFCCRAKSLTFFRFLRSACLFLAVILLPSTAVAQAKISDFDAESIEGSIDLLPGVEPIPVELVEEQNPNAEVHAKHERNDTGDTVVPAAETGETNSDTAASNDKGKNENAFDSEMTTALNVNDVDITALVKTFSKLTKRNYIVDNAVKGKITIHLPTPVTIAEALRILDSVLLLKGFTTVPAGDNIWKVVPAKDAKQTTIPLFFTEDQEQNAKTNALVTQLVRLRHVKAEEMQTLLAQFVSRDGLVNAFGGTNSLIIIDAASNIERLTELVNQLDVPAVDQDLTIIPIVHAESKDVADKLKEILGEEGQTDASSPGSGLNPQLVPPRIPQRVNMPNSGGAGGNVGKRTLPFKVIPDERTNSLIIVADPELTAKIRALVEKLDSPVDLSGGRFYVYQLQHADAEQLAEMLTQLISGTSASSERSGGTTGSSLTRSSRSSQAAQTSVRDRLTSAILRRPGGAGATGSTGAETGRVNFEGEVSLAADPATNSLIINAARADYKRLEEVIGMLDIKRRQVMVEATILEVSLNDDQGFGVELQGTAANDQGGVMGQTNFGGLSNLLTNPAGLSDLSIAAASTGTVTLPGGLTIPSQAALVTAMSRLSNINVLSSPTILTTDNEEAEIIVGENVPFVTSTSTDPSNLGNTFNQVERQDVGITLRITPQISTGDFVTLKIFVEISNVVSGTRNDPNGPTTNIRTTETNVEVKDDQMVATGGLISDEVTTSSRGVPFLQDIPVLGFFFKREDEVIRRKNLLILITPRIIKDQFDAREDTVEKRDHISDAIQRQGAKPTREEVLHNHKIDSVVPEIEFQEGEVLPSTITPPLNSGSAHTEIIDSDEAEAIRRTNERFKALGQELPQLQGGGAPAPNTKTTLKTIRPDDITEETLSFSVKPELPGASKGISKPTTIPAPSVNATVPPPARMAESPRVARGGVYVVLKAIQADAPAPAFMRKDTNGTLGLVVPGGSSDAAQFFSVGQKYSYKTRDGQAQFVCIGIYASTSEAKVVHPELSTESYWYQLTPRETLQLGTTGWIK